MQERLDDPGLLEALLPGAATQRSAACDTLRAMIAARRRTYPAGSVLKLVGEDAHYVFLVLSGWLLASKTLSDGQRQIIDVILPGGILDPASADLITSAMEIEALTDNGIAMIPRREWHRACDEHPALSELNRQVVGAAFSRISERMLRLGKAPAETMIAFALCELCLRSTAQGLVAGTVFHIPMTQQQLGDLCGLSAVHICRTLRRLERNGVLSVTNHMDILVHDTQALSQIAEIDPEDLHHKIISAA